MSDDERLRCLFGLVNDFGVGRLRDLALRHGSFSLTSAESLALAVLRGGDNGESALGPLIDAAQEEFGNGTYRVPVRVIGDKSRMRVVFTSPSEASAAELEHMAGELRKFIDGKLTQVVVINVGSKLEVYEVGDGEPAGVVVKDASK